MSTSVSARQPGARQVNTIRSGGSQLVTSPTWYSSPSTNRS
jgi:hypothetical protein